MITTGYCNIQVNADYDYGGWAILIVYEDSTLNFSQLNIYNGFKIMRCCNSTIGLSPFLSINLNNLMFTNTSGSKLGFLAWNGPSTGAGGSISFNNNFLVNGLNPNTTGVYNGTNSFTGSSNLYNMDLDYFDISNFINVGDTQATIYIGNYVTPIALNFFVTRIPSELPDATVEIISTNFTACQAGSLDLEFTVFNTNATDILPSGTPVSLFLEDNTGNPVYISTINTTQNIPIGGSETLTTTISVPPNVASPGELVVDVNRDAAGNQPIAENNKQNNTDSISITLPEAPPNPVLDDISGCGTPNETETDLEDATSQVDTNLYAISFHPTQNEADNGQNEIIPSNQYIPSSQTETIFVRVEDGNGCFSTGSFQLELLPLPQIQAPTPLVSCEENPNSGTADFQLS